MGGLMIILSFIILFIFGKSYRHIIYILDNVPSVNNNNTNAIINIITSP